MRLSKLIKQILLIFFTCSGVLTTDIGFASPNLENVKAIIFLCNPYLNDYCQNSSAYGEGFGIIVFDNKNEESIIESSFSMRPGGVDTNSASIMTGNLQAFQMTQWRDHRDQELFYSNEVKVSGYFGLDPIHKMKIIFYITKLEELN